MTLAELKAEVELRRKTYDEMEAHLPDERLKISARSARDCYSEVAALLRELQPDAELLAMFVDAAGGEIVVRREHMERASEGDMICLQNLEDDSIAYRRQFEIKALDS